ncbi:MAG: 1-deoxy-D-xylulose-5-phosphate reductoisomerase [Bacteroidota bacterium]
MKKRIAILGSTGSIGTQTLEVVDAYPDVYQVEVLTAMNNAELLIQQALKYSPNAVVIANDKKYSEVADALAHTDIKVFAGDSSLIDIVEMESIDIVMMALVGYSGLKPTYNAIKHRKPIALSNKEVLVVGGELITALSIENNVPIFPVDSEHSAIFQCLTGEFHNPIEKLILTASGGPFRGKSKEFLESVTVEQALNHPNWNMGNKVTIDSASLMNKGLEVIEAHWLFQVPVENIEVLVHPQSVIHSMVQYCDGSIKAQLGVPDMKLPIMYSLSYPNRLPSPFPRLSFDDYTSLTFEKPDRTVFRNLDIAYKSIALGGNTPCIMNAANEIAVEAFLNKKIGFLQLSDIIEHTIQKVGFIAKPTMDDYFETDKESRIIAKQLINQSI